MHEMAIAENLLELALNEARSRGCSRLLVLTVQYGQISGVMPDALRLAFQILVSDTAHAKAELILEELPLRLRCPFCQHRFEPGENDSIFQPCPSCGEDFAQIVEQGRELLLTSIEAV